MQSSGASARARRSLACTTPPCSAFPHATCTVTLVDRLVTPRATRSPRSTATASAQGSPHARSAPKCFTPPQEVFRMTSQTSALSHERQSHWQQPALRADGYLRLSAHGSAQSCCCATTASPPPITTASLVPAGLVPALLFTNETFGTVPIVRAHIEAAASAMIDAEKAARAIPV
jgi:hypothetical protein